MQLSFAHNTETDWDSFEIVINFKRISVREETSVHESRSCLVL